VLGYSFSHLPFELFAIYMSDEVVMSYFLILQNCDYVLDFDIGSIKPLIAYLPEVKGWIA
jgi:hypothetical protein